MKRGRLAALALGTLAALPCVSGACSSPQALLGTGAQCLQTTDCQESLFCVQQKSGVKICSADLSNIVSTEEAGAADARARDGNFEGGEAGAVREGGASDASGAADASGTADAGGATDGAQAMDTGAAPEAQAPADDGGGGGRGGRLRAILRT